MSVLDFRMIRLELSRWTQGTITVVHTLSARMTLTLGRRRHALNNRGHAICRIVLRPHRSTSDYIAAAGHGQGNMTLRRMPHTNMDLNPAPHTQSLTLLDPVRFNNE